MRWLILLLTLWGSHIAAQESVLRADYPSHYRVQTGDTLWDIAERFLTQPWRWQEIWQANPHIDNPHLIYPGDDIVIVHVDGQPRLTIGDRQPTASTSSSLETQVLKPRLREVDRNQAIPTLPLDVIAPFLVRGSVFDDDSPPLDSGYVIAMADQRVTAVTGDTFYARGVMEGVKRYMVLRQTKAYKAWRSDKVLGREAFFLGKAYIVRLGDPATLVVEESIQEILIGDRLLPWPEGESLTDFVPHAPIQLVEGRIVSVYGKVAQINQYDVVVIDRGQDDFVDKGTVLAVYQHGRRIIDNYAEGLDRSVELPEHRAGLVMVFDTFEDVSLGLVVSAQRAIKIGDRVRNP